MRGQLRGDLTVAIKTGDRITISALRSALAALENAETADGDRSSRSAQPSSEYIAGAAAGLGTAEVPRRNLTDAHAEAIVRREVTERLQAADEAEILGRLDRADRLRAEARVLAKYIEN